jgi:hypothetical protein
MRPGLARIAASPRFQERLVRCSNAPCDSIKAAVRFAANMVRKKFPWPFYPPNKVKVARTQSCSKVRWRTLEVVGEMEESAAMHPGSQPE